MQTKCKDCSFAVYNNLVQTGCEFDRISKFGSSAKKTRDDEKKFYTIQRVCNYYRNKNNTLADKDSVQADSAVSFDIIFNYENLTNEESDNIVAFINSDTYYQNKSNVMLLHEYDHDENVKDHIIKISLGSKRNITVTLCHPVDEFLNNHIIKSENDFHIIINKNIAEVTPQILVDINRIINDELKQCVVFKSADYTAIHNLSYKLYSKFNPGLKYIDYVNHIIEEARNNNFYKEF